MIRNLLHITRGIKCVPTMNGKWLERFHGLDRARGYGLKSMGIQAKLLLWR